MLGSNELLYTESHNVHFVQSICIGMGSQWVNMILLVFVLSRLLVKHFKQIW